MSQKRTLTPDWLSSLSVAACLTGKTARNGVVAVLDQGILSATNFIIGIMLARLLTKEEFGAYTFSFSLLLAANGLQMALVTSPLTVLAAAPDTGHYREYFSIISRIQLVVSFCIAMIGAALSGVLTGTGLVHRELGAVLLSMSIALFFVQEQEYFRRALYVRFRVGSVLKNDALCCSLQVVGILSLWKIGGGTWSSSSELLNAGYLSGSNAFLIVGLGATAGAVLGLFQVRNDFVGEMKNVHLHMKETWDFAKWSLTTFALTYLKDNSAPYLLAIFVGFSEFAAMNAVLLVLKPLQLVFSSVLSIITPRMAREYDSHGWKACTDLAWKFTLVLSVILVVPAICIAFFSRELLDLLFQSKYSSYGLLLTIWAFLFPLVGVWNAVFGQIPFVTRRPKTAFLGLAVFSPLALLAAILLVPSFGVWGAFFINTAAALASTALAYGFVLNSEKQQGKYSHGSYPKSTT